MIRTLLALLPGGSTGRLVTHLLFTVVSVALRALSAVLLVPLVAALFSTDPSTAWPWVGWLALAAVGGWIVDWIVAKVAFALGFSVLEHGQSDLAERLNTVRLTWFGAEQTATARQAVAAIGPELVGLFIYLATPMLSGILLPVAIAIALIPVSVPLAVAALAGVPILLGAYWLSGRLSRSSDRAASAANSELTERVIEFARTQSALRASRRVEPERSHVGAALDAQHGATLRLLAMQIPGQLVFSFASQISLILLAGVTVWLSVTGDLIPAQAVALIVVIARYLEPFTALAGLSAAMESSLTMLRRVRTVLDAPQDPAGEHAAGLIGPPELALRGVSFEYDDETPPVLDGLELVFDAGTTTAIVGPSGSGKSTILALLAGLHHPSAGAVTIDGTDVRELTFDARRARSSVVFQQPFLFDTNVRENVLVGDPDADDRRLSTAAELGRVDTIVNRLPDGWSTRVGEGGSLLSGGERQRVSIARALLKPAPVLLVDEATSALDNENEAAVAAALSGDPMPRTRVIVAHRLSSIRTADRVVFLEKGCVVEDGTYDELVASGGRFAEFHAQQHAAAKWKLGRRPVP